MALPVPSPDSTCLVTGASSGIGAEIAREWPLVDSASRLSHARREDRLRGLADELVAAHRIRAEVIAGISPTSGLERAFRTSWPTVAWTWTCSSTTPASPRWVP